jgi:hypothetical protein
MYWTIRAQFPAETTEIIGFLLSQKKHKYELCVKSAEFDNIKADGILCCERLGNYKMCFVQQTGFQHFQK